MLIKASPTSYVVAPSPMKAVCMCTAQCEASICLKDRGCPANQACRNFQCVDPCADAECPGNTPCLVEDHKAICKFCPSGFVVDKDYGCLESGAAPRCGNPEMLTSVKLALGPLRY